MGQQLQTQPAVHTGVPGIQASPSPFGGIRGSSAVPMAPGTPGTPPQPPVRPPQFHPGPVAPPMAAVPGRPPTAPSQYGLALRNALPR